MGGDVVVGREIGCSGVVVANVHVNIDIDIDVDVDVDDGDEVGHVCDRFMEYCH